MSVKARQLEISQEDQTNLSLFPLDQHTLRRLATTLSSEQIKQNRVAMYGAIRVLLEPVFEEIDRMENLASTLVSASPDLLRDITKMREAAHHLYLVLGESVR